MQIGNDPQRNVDRGKERKIERRERTGLSRLAPKGLLFGDHLHESTVEAANGSLEGMMSDVDATSKSFVDNPTEDQFQRYRQAVMAFVRKAQGQAFQVAREFDSRNRLHSIVREIDHKVAEIQDQVLSAQNRPLELAARVREIRGFLLDMYI